MAAPGLSFYARDTVTVARELLGCRLTHHAVGGIVVETEAYLGLNDPASHAFRGPTERNRAMFGEPGFAYVYFIYGNHYCLNVVVHPPGQVGAVLLRALDPRQGLEDMRARRGAKHPDRLLTNGPGRLCQALGIGREQYGAPFDGSQGLLLEPGEPPGRIRVDKRIGLNVAAEEPLRFFVEGNPYVSKGSGG